MRHITDRPSGHAPRVSTRLNRASELAIAGLLVFVFIGGLGVLAALVPVGHGVVRGESSTWTCWRSLASFPWRC